MKYSQIAILAVVVGLFGSAQNSFASCACLCLEGTERSLCNDIDEAAAGQNACLSNGMMAEAVCPQPIGTVDATVEEEIPAGAENCTHARLYDPLTKKYTVATNICDVAS